jgi:hypothetical protein
MVSTVPEDVAFVYTVMLWLNVPGRPLGLYVALIVVFAPGAKGSLDHSDTAHPHDEVTLEMIRGELPVFLISKLYETGPAFSLINPKL